MQEICMAARLERMKRLQPSIEGGTGRRQRIKRGRFDKEDIPVRRRGRRQGADGGGNTKIDVALKNASFGTLENAKGGFLRSGQNKQKCFWVCSKVGKALGGCEFKNCKFMTRTRTQRSRMGEGSRIGAVSTSSMPDNQGVVLDELEEAWLTTARRLSYKQRQDQLKRLRKQPGTFVSAKTMIDASVKWAMRAGKPKMQNSIQTVLPMARKQILSIASIASFFFLSQKHKRKPEPPLMDSQKK